MKKNLYILGVLLATCSCQTGPSFAAEKMLSYHSFASADSEQVIAQTYVEFKDLADGKISISRKKPIEKCMVHDEFILNEDYSLLSWQRVCQEEDTDFTVERKGDFVIIQGQLRGKLIDKEISVGQKELHIYPKYSLSKFALSDTKKMRFWTIRRDKLTRLPMQAINKGEGIIVINGKKIEAIKVYYSITGKLREKSYNHYYYYRKSDGLFIKKIESKGRIEVLVKEE